MAQRTRRPGWRWLAGLLSLTVAACVTAPPAPVPPLGAEQQRSLLQALPEFSFAGRVAVAAAGDGFNASVQWRQLQQVTTLKLSGPLGAGSLQLDWRPEGLRVVTSRGAVLEGQDAQDAVQQELGFVPPFDALRYWILGVAAPGADSAVETRAADGLLLQLAQLQWQIAYERFVAARTPAGSVQLPTRLTATRDGLRLRLVIDRWRLE